MRIFAGRCKIRQSKQQSEPRGVTNAVIVILLHQDQPVPLPDLIQEAKLNFEDLEVLDERIKLWRKSGLVDVDEEHHVQRVKLTQFGVDFAQKNLAEIV